MLRDLRVRFWRPRKGEAVEIDLNFSGQLRAAGSLITAQVLGGVLDVVSCES